MYVVGLTVAMEKCSDEAGRGRLVPLLEAARHYEAALAAYPALLSAARASRGERPLPVRRAAVDTPEQMRSHMESKESAAELLAVLNHAADNPTADHRWMLPHMHADDRGIVEELAARFDDMRQGLAAWVE